jgi:hypothetical protein
MAGIFKYKQFAKCCFTYLHRESIVILKKRRKKIKKGKKNKSTCMTIFIFNRNTSKHTFYAAHPITAPASQYRHVHYGTEYKVREKSSKEIHVVFTSLMQRTEIYFTHIQRHVHCHYHITSIINTK